MATTKGQGSKKRFLEVPGFQSDGLTGEDDMSLMCSMDGCKQKSGMCIHEKMMLGLMLVMAVVAAVIWLK